MRIIRTETNAPWAEARAIAGKLIPFRAPHYTTSSRGIEGELRLAVGGVLYLDDLAEVKRETVAHLAALIRNGGPLPLAIVVDCHNPFEAGGSSEDAKMATRYAKRIAEAVEALELAAAALGLGRGPRYGAWQSN